MGTTSGSEAEELESLLAETAPEQVPEDLAKVDVSEFKELLGAALAEAHMTKKKASAKKPSAKKPAAKPKPKTAKAAKAAVAKACKDLKKLRALASQMLKV